jgi:hypothetical protein
MRPTRFAPQEALKCVLPRPVDDDEDCPPVEGDGNLPLG